MGVVILFAFFYGLCALIRAAREHSKQRQREREMERIRQENARRAAEAARLREEWRRQQAEAKERAKRQAELEREQMRIAREQERQAKEQARQAEQLARHEERITKLEQQLTLAEREIAHYQPIVDRLRQEAEALAFKVEHYESRGLPCGGYRDQLERINEKLYRAETKVIKAELTKQAAQQRLAA